MKIKNVITTALLALGLGVGVFAGLNLNKDEPVVEAEATSEAVPFTWTSGEYFYVNGSSTYYGANNAKCAVYFFLSSDNSKNAWTTANLDHYRGDYFRFEVPKCNNTSYTWDRCIVIRFNPSWTTPDWNYKDGIYNQTVDIEKGWIVNGNCIKITGYEGEGNKKLSWCVDTYEHYGLKSGEHAYLTLQYAGGNWDSAPAKYALYFFTCGSKAGDGWSCIYSGSGNNRTLSNSFMWLVEGQVGFSGALYECIVPQLNGEDVVWGSVKAIRFQTWATAPGWSGVTDEGTNINYLNDTIKNRNVVQKGSTDSTDCELEVQVTKEERAEFYGTYFLDQIQCTGSGSIKPASSWSNVTNEYNNHLSYDVRGEIRESSASDLPSSTDLQKAMYRYDYIVFHKGYEGYGDFIGRSSSSGKSFTGVNAGLKAAINSNSSVVAITIVGVASLAAVAAYFLLRNKKEN